MDADELRLSLVRRPCSSVVAADFMLVMARPTTVLADKRECRDVLGRKVRVLGTDEVRVADLPPPRLSIEGFFLMNGDGKLSSSSIL